MKCYPYENGGGGGGGGSLSHAEGCVCVGGGEHIKFWGSFYAVA